MRPLHVLVGFIICIVVAQALPPAPDPAANKLVKVICGDGQEEMEVSLQDIPKDGFFAHPLQPHSSSKPSPPLTVDTSNSNTEDVEVHCKDEEIQSIRTKFPCGIFTFAVQHILKEGEDPLQLVWEQQQQHQLQQQYGIRQNGNKPVGPTFSTPHDLIQLLEACVHYGVPGHRLESLTFEVERTLAHLPPSPQTMVFYDRLIALNQQTVERALNYHWTLDHLFVMAENNHQRLLKLWANHADQPRFMNLFNELFIKSATTGENIGAVIAVLESLPPYACRNELLRNFVSYLTKYGSMKMITAVLPLPCIYQYTASILEGLNLHRNEPMTPADWAFLGKETNGTLWPLFVSIGWLEVLPLLEVAGVLESVINTSYPYQPVRPYGHPIPLQTGDTMLIVAARLGLEKVVAWLIERGADISATNFYGETVLHAAAENPHLLKMLLSLPNKQHEKIDMSKMNHAGLTVLRMLAGHTHSNNPALEALTILQESALRPDGPSAQSSLAKALRELLIPTTSTTTPTTTTTPAPATTTTVTPAVHKKMEEPHHRAKDPNPLIKAAIDKVLG